jgi:hypothetical protein
MIGIPKYGFAKNASLELIITNPSAVNFIQSHVKELSVMCKDFKEYICLNPNPDVMPIINEYVMGYIHEQLKESNEIPKIVHEIMDDLIHTIEEIHQDEKDHPYDDNYLYNASDDNDDAYDDNDNDNEYSDEYSDYDSDDEPDDRKNAYKYLQLLCNHSYTIKLLEKNISLLDDICWKNLSQNPYAISLLEKNIDQVDLWHLASNENGIHILENQIDHIMLKTILLKTIWYTLAGSNPDAIEFLAKNLDKINTDIHFWNIICENPNAIKVMEDYIHDDIKLIEIHAYYICKNFNAIHIIEKHIDHLPQTGWNGLSKNPKAIHLLEQNIDKIHWSNLCLNLHPKAMPLIETYLDNLNSVNEYFWTNLCKNPNAIHILEKNIDKLDNIDCWYNLCSNIEAIPIIENNLDKLDDICWNILCNHEKAMPMIKQNLDRLNTTCWDTLSSNPDAIDILLSLNYIHMTKNMSKFKQELMDYVFNPDRMMNLSSQYNIEFKELVKLY